jgi:hypothetical protein
MESADVYFKFTFNPYPLRLGNISDIKKTYICTVPVSMYYLLHPGEKNMDYDVEGKKSAPYTLVRFIWKDLKYNHRFLLFCIVLS